MKTTPTWRECIHTNILEFTFITSAIGIITLRKRSMEGGKLIIRLKTIIN